MPYSVLALTLAQLLESEDDTIRRNAKGILKLCQRCEHKYEQEQCVYCYAPDMLEKLRRLARDPHSLDW